MCDILKDCYHRAAGGRAFWSLPWRQALAETLKAVTTQRE